MSTASLLEVAWTALALVGVSVSALNGWDAIADLQLLKAQSRNGSALVIAKGIVRNEAIRLVTQSAFLTIGVIAMVLRNVDPYSGSRFFLAALFIAAEAGLVYASIADRRDAKYLLAVPKEDI